VTNVVDRPGMRRVRRALAHELDVLRNCVGRACARPLPPLLRTAHPVLPPADGTAD
jgi:hypothetical protein